MSYEVGISKKNITIKIGVYNTSIYTYIYSIEGSSDYDYPDNFHI